MRTSFVNGRVGLRGLLLGLAGAGLAAGAVVADTSCSLIVDTNDNQCAVNSDCSSLFPGRTCVNGVCVAADGGGASCSVNADCSSMGSTYVCRNSTCANLVTTLCTTLHATTANPADAYNDDSAIIFGSIMPTGNASDGPYGHLVEDSIKLALDDFGKVTGIPGLNGGANRPIVLVGCNDGPNEDPAQTDVAAKHLINDLGVAAIIGYAFSGNTVSVAQDVTIPQKTLLFSPSATSAQITGLETAANDYLVWRTAPSDNVQAQALVLHFPNVVTAAEAKYTKIDPAHLKVAIVNHSDLYGSGLGNTVEGTLKFNGLAATDPTNTGCSAYNGPAGGPTNPNVCYLRVDYGPSTDPDPTKVPIIAGFEPDIIFLFGFNEGPDTIFKGVETAWSSLSPAPTDGHYPFWIFSDGGEVTSLWATHPDATTPSQTDPADITTEDQRERVSGSVPGTNATSWPYYGSFLSEFSGSSYSGDGSADTIGPAGAYDIMYLLAFSTVMLGNKYPLTGPNLVKFGLQQMQKGTSLPTIQISPDNLLSAFPTLALGTPVNVTGVSGPLPFNGKGDITTADIQIWCVPKSSPPDTDIGTSAINSGYYFDSTTGVMAGCIATACALNPPYTPPLTCP